MIEVNKAWDIRRILYEYGERRRAEAEKYRQYAVEAPGLEAFLERYHRQPMVAVEAYNERRQELRNYGYVVIPAEQSVTGEPAAYFGWE